MDQTSTSEKMPGKALADGYIGLRRTAESRAAVDEAATAEATVPAPRSEVQVIGGKSTSPEMAALMGLYAGMSDVKMTSLHNADRHKFCSDVRRIAASGLTQVEPNDEP